MIMRWYLAAALVVASLAWQSEASATTVTVSYSAEIADSSDSAALDHFGLTGAKTFTGTFVLNDLGPPQLDESDTPLVVGSTEDAFYRSSSGTWTLSNALTASGDSEVQFTRTVGDPDDSFAPETQFVSFGTNNDVVGSAGGNLYIAYTQVGSPPALYTLPTVPKCYSSSGDSICQGQLMSSSLTPQLVYGSLSYGGSSVEFGVTRFEIAAAPLPPAGILFATGIAAIGFIATRASIRKRANSKT
jgi:hypothetical protein